MKTDDPTEIQPVAPRERVAIPDHVLLRVIGRGSYGEVWEARNVMGTPRAVKIVRRQDFDSARPFDREFEGIQRYEPVSRSHAGLVQVLHVGMGPDGDYFYYVMELADRDAGADGDYLPKMLRSELQRRQALPVEECIETGIALASGLGHLHRSGLVHRDVKPSNIIYVNGAPKLADVGLVARLSDTRSMVGTEGYFAPEGTGQPRSDVFSLGKVLYECITGLDRQQFPDVPDSWGAGPESKAAFEFMEIVLRAAENDPARRYAGTDEMLADLALLKAGKSLRYLRRVETRLKRAGQILAFSALGLSLAGGAWLYEFYRRSQLETAKAAATRAQEETQHLLAESLVAEARAVRLSGQAGAREKVLDTVRRGLKAGAPLYDLRTQAASALALTGVGPFLPQGTFAAPNHRVIWSPGGNHAVLTEVKTGRTRVLDRNTGHDIASFDTGPDVLEIVVSKGARWLATIHFDHHLSLWSTADGIKRWTLPPMSHPRAVSFSKDGTWLVTTTEAELIACASASGESVTLRKDQTPLRAILLAPDATWLAALPVPQQENDRPVKDLGFRIYSGLPGRLPGPGDVSRIQESTLESDIQLEGPSISADSRYLAAAVSEDRLRVWEMPSKSQVVWLRGHQRSVRGTAFHPDDSGIVASTSWDGTTRLWDISTRQQIMVIPTGGEQLCFAPDRGELLVRTWGGDALRSAPLSRRSALRVLMLPPFTPLGLFSAVSFHPDGSLLAAAGASGVLVWETATGRVSTAQVHGKPMDWRSTVFSPADGSLYFSGVDGLFRRSVGRADSGTPIFGGKETVLTGFSSCLDWSGSTLAVSGRFDENGQPGVALIHPDGTSRHLPSSHPPDRIAASPDGRWVAASRYPDAGGTLWDLQTMPPASRPLSSASRAAFGFTSNSRILITGNDHKVTFAPTTQPDMTAAPPLSRPDCEVVPAHSASSAAAGLTAISTGPTSITLCHHQSLEPILTLDSPLTPFDCTIAFSPDGKKLALAGGVSRVIVWDIAWIREQLTAQGLGW